MQKKRKQKPETRMRNLFRGIWRQSPHRNEALKRARLRRGIYLCAECGGEFRPKEVTVDHIEPCGVLDLENIGAFAARLFAPQSGLQVLCGPCHKIKTREDRARIKVEKERTND